MNKYKVLWFDDEYQTLDIIRESAILNGITLNGFDNAEDGLNELQNNLKLYDAIVVDGIFYTSHGQYGNATKDDAFVKVAREIDKLESKRIIPWFILSGQYSFTKDSNKFAEAYKNNKVYDKTRDEEIEQLWIDIKKEADQILLTQIRHNYAKAFSVFELGILDTSQQYLLIEILSCLESKDYSKKNLNVIRDLLEVIFLSFIKVYSFIPESFIKKDSLPNLEWCTIYLEGRDTKDGNNLFHNIKKYKLEIPNEIATCFRYIKTISSSYSHYSEEEYVRSPFISSTHALLTILEWLPDLIKENKL